MAVLRESGRSGWVKVYSLKAQIMIFNGAKKKAGSEMKMN